MTPSPPVAESAEHARIWHDRLRQAMLQKGLSTRKLSALAGLGSSYVSDLLRGRAEPTLKNLEKICSALGIELASLIEPLAATHVDFEAHLERNNSGVSAPNTFSVCAHSCTHDGEWAALSPGRSFQIEHEFTSHYIHIYIEDPFLSLHFEAGDVISGRICRDFSRIPFGKPCIIRTSSGARFIRIPHEGTKYGKPILATLNGRGNLVLDAMLDWYAPIKLVIKDGRGKTVREDLASTARSLVDKS